MNEEAVKKAEAILRKHGIEMKVGACGCCNSPWISMKYQGEVILDDEGDANLNTEWEKDVT